MTTGLQHQIGSVPEPRPHDLLWIAGSEALRVEHPLPDWVEAAITAAPVVVVRRGACSGHTIPVGVRGQSRAQRFGAFVARQAVRRRVTPEDLAKTMCWRGNRRAEFAAMRRVLDAVAREWNAIAWGPAGSVGFELATGVPVTTCESDLDLVIHAPQRISRREAEAVLQSAEGLEVCTDIRLETPFGSVALQEYVAPAASRMLMKTVEGPRLVADPWADPNQAALDLAAAH